MIKRRQERSKKGFWMSYREMINVPMHWHEFYEVELCINGTGTQIINGIESPLNKGVLTLLSPHDFHRLESLDNTPIGLFTFCFYEHAISSGIIKLLEENKTPYRIEFSDEDFEKIHSLFSELLSEINSENSIDYQAARCRIGLICMDIIRKEINESKKSIQNSDSFSDSNDLKSIQDAVNYINEHYTERITREDVASMLCLNPTYFSSLFKSKIGISFSKYIIDCRMAQAMRLLRYTDEKVNSIMQAVGYTSSAIFYRKFEEYYHMSPNQARKAYKSINE